MHIFAASFRGILPAIASLALTLIGPETSASTSTRGVDCPERTVAARFGRIGVEKLADLEFPWGMAQLPDGSLLITEKPGRLRIFQDGLLSSPISGVPDLEYRGQGGLLGVTVHPDYAFNGFVYLYFVEAAASQPDDAEVDADPRLGPFVDKGDTIVKGGAVARARMAGNRLLDVQVIWRQAPKTVGLGHFGGHMAFAADGTLYITSGERQLFEPAQDSQSTLGKIVRLNDDGSIPEDNPFAGAPAPRNAIWSSGHRNPLGLALRPENGAMYVHEMGPLFGDELNRLEPGRDYGWPTVSNGENYDLSEIPHHETQPDAFARPEIYWRPAISPSGLVFYTGALFPETWRNNALIGGLSSQAIVRVAFKGEAVLEEERINLQLRVRDLLQAPDGALLVLTDAEDGALLRLTPVSEACSTQSSRS